MQAITPTDQQSVSVLHEYVKLHHQRKTGAGWFYWIAGMSLLNSLILLSGTNWSFFIGLGFTQLSDGVVTAVAKGYPSDIATILKIVAFGLDAVIASVFVLFGVFSARGHRWAFVVGMVLYGLDALIFLLIPDLLSIGVHVFALLGLFGGLKAVNALAHLPHVLSDSPLP